jgi:hypothetical protein
MCTGRLVPSPEASGAFAADHNVSVSMDKSRTLRGPALANQAVLDMMSC